MSPYSNLSLVQRNRWIIGYLWDIFFSKCINKFYLLPFQTHDMKHSTFWDQMYWFILRTTNISWFFSLCCKVLKNTPENILVRLILGLWHKMASNSICLWTSLPLRASLRKAHKTSWKLPSNIQHTQIPFAKFDLFQSKIDEIRQF